jgi:Sulfatase
MLRSAAIQTIVVLTLGAGFGYLAASSDGHPFGQARATSVAPPGTPEVRPEGEVSPAACSDGAGRATLVAARFSEGRVQSGSAQPSAKKPNILVIFGDDIGIPQISAYTQGLMGYRTPNIDRIAKEGALFTDSYGQQSCTAGRASFILGQEPFRTGLLTIGMPGDPHGITPWMPTIADALKSQGYATGQFGKNHLGDHDEHLPTAHGFDEFFGNLYHLNAEEEPEG